MGIDDNPLALPNEIGTREVCSRVGETNIKSSDPNSEPQGITNYDFELPCKILDHSDQFGLGPHPPLWGRG